MRNPALLLSSLLLSSTFLSADSVDAGRGEVEVTVPAKYDKAAPAPLVILLHGYTSSGKGQDRYFKISTLADKYGFLFIAPDGTRENSRAKNRFWNATEACCDFHKSEVDDSKYLSDLIAATKKKFSVDPNRVYLMGHSNGGFMSHRMAMDHPETIAAIAALNGAAPMKLTGEKPKRPVNILHIHGTKDRLNKFGSGGKINGVQYPGAEETVQRWAEFYGIAKKVVHPDKKLDLDKKLEGRETRISQYGGGTVELWTIENGSHIPRFTDHFNKLVIEWLLAHPKKTAE